MLTLHVSMFMKKGDVQMCQRLKTRNNRNGMLDILILKNISSMISASCCNSDILFDHKSSLM